MIGKCEAFAVMDVRTITYVIFKVNYEHQGNIFVFQIEKNVISKYN